MKIEETIKTEQIYDNSNSFTGNLLNTVSPYQNFNNFTRNMENIRNTQAQIQGAQINRFYLNQIYMQNIQNMNYFSNMMSRRITPPVIIWNNFNNYPQINTIPMKFEHIVPKDEFKSE